MDLAIQHDRPALTEVVLVLAACALLLFGLVKLDRAAADSAADRARETLAEQAKAAASRPEKVEVVRPDDGEEPSLGDSGPIAIGLGGAWSGAAASAVGHSEYEREVGPGASGELSRTLRPGPSSTPTTDRPAVNIGGAPAVAVGPRSDSGPGSQASLLALIAGCGIIMSLAGAALLVRTPR